MAGRWQQRYFDPSSPPPHAAQWPKPVTCRWRLVEEYGADRFTVESDGRLRFTGGFPDADSVLSWVLTFGDKAELLEPEELRQQLGDLTATLADRYRGGN